MPNELHAAAADKNGFNTVKTLLEANPELINDKHSDYGTRAVDFAAQTGSLETLEYLIGQNAIIDARGEKYNVLYWACENSQDVIDYVTNPDNKLIEKFNDGTTYFHAAIVAGKNEEIRQQLHEHPELAYLENDKSECSFNYALRAKNKEILVSLINLLGNDLLLQGSQWQKSLNTLFKMAISSKAIFEDYLDLFKKLNTYCNLALLEDSESPVLNYYAIRINDYLAWLHFRKEDLHEAKPYFKKAVERFEEVKDFLPKKRQESLFNRLSRFQAELHLAIEVNQRGLKCMQGALDASSFYTAMIDGLHQLNHGAYANITVDELRTVAFNHVSNNRDFYELFIDGDMACYLKDIMRAETSPDQLVITALSREFNMTFYTLNSRSSAPEIIKPHNPSALLKFAYLEHYCYYPLSVVAELKPVIAIETEINGAGEDNFEGVITGFYPASMKKESEEQNDDKQEVISKKSYRPRPVGLFSSSNSNVSPTDESHKEPTESKAYSI